MKSAIVIPFPDPEARKKRCAKKRNNQKLIDCFFGDIDLFRLLADTEAKVTVLREKNTKDSVRDR